MEFYNNNHLPPKKISYRTAEVLLKANPHGAPLGYIAESEGRIIGVALFVPSRMKFRSVEKTVYHGGPVILPEYRGRKVYSALYSMFLKEIKKRGALTYGTSNTERLSRFYLRVGGIHLCDSLEFTYAHRHNLIRMFPPKVRALINSLLRSSASEGRLLHSYHTFYCDSPGSSFEGFLAEAHSMYDIIQLRSVQMLDWRMSMYSSKQPRLIICEKKGRIVGYAFVYTRGDVARIDDLLTTDKQAVSCILNRIVSDTKGSHNKFIIYSTSDPIQQEMLIAAGFTPNKSRKICISPPEAPDNLVLMGLSSTDPTTRPSVFMDFFDMYFA